MGKNTLAKRQEVFGGILLIGLGLSFLLSRYLPTNMSWGLWLLPLLGLVFLTGGIIYREIGFLIPGGILTGLGLGVVLVGRYYDMPMNGMPHRMDTHVMGTMPAGMSGNTIEGGLFLLSFALGWLLITIFSAIFTNRVHWWPLIPGGIIALIGFGLIYGGLMWQMVVWLNILWPLLLVLGGLYLVWESFHHPIQPV